MKKILDKLSKSIVYTLGFTLFITITLMGDFRFNETEAKVDNRVTIIKNTIDDSKEVKEQIFKRSCIPVKQMSERDIINSYVKDIASKYNIEPEIIMSVIEQESEYNPNAINGNCLGLMQISSYWHRDRAARLGVTNFYDPYSNILLGVDYISELQNKYGDIRLVLMLYNMDNNSALRMYRNGYISSYAINIINRAEKYKKGV